MKINNLLLFIGIFAVFLTILYLGLVATAEEIDLGDGQYQEIPSYDINAGEEVEYSGSDENGSLADHNGHLDDSDPEEEYQENDVDQIDDSEDTVENNNDKEVGTTEENESTSTEMDNKEDNIQDDYQQEIITLLNELDQSIKKLIISIWVLFGLLLGTKLIKGLFGYGG